jgi:hypothetical protein
VNLQIIKVYGMLSRVRYAALLLLFLLLFSLHTGCISIGPPPPKGDEGDLKSVPTSPIGEGPIQDITSRNAPKVSLDDAISSLPAAVQEGGFDIKGMTITKVWGYGVDSAGLGKTWVLGMQRSGKTTLLTFSEGEYRVLDLPTTLPEEEVKIKELISPQDLFRRNLISIVREMNRLKVGECDLTLDQNTYQVTIHSASESSTLSFNAKTGELILISAGERREISAVLQPLTATPSNPETLPPTTASLGRLATPSIGAIGAVIIGILAFHDKRESQGTE